MTTSTEIRTFFEGLIDYSLDDTLTYNLMDQVDKELAAMRNWEILKNLDESLSASPSDSYTTAKALPTRYMKTLTLFVGDDIVPYRQVAFELRERFKNRGRFFFVDFANSNYYLASPPASASTLHHWFMKYPPTMIAGVTPVWPSQFLAYHAYKMAEKFFAIDLGEKGRSWDDRWRLYANDLLNQMIKWDAMMKHQSIQNQSLAVDYSSDPLRSDLGY